MAKSLFKFITSQENIQSLCASPVNAIGLIDYIAWQTRDEADQEVAAEYLPQTRAHLMLLLLLNILQKHSGEQHTRMSTRDILKQKASTIKNLASLASSGLFSADGASQIFTEEDLQSHGLTVDEVTGCGLMTGNITSMADTFQYVTKVLLEFPHLLFQETLGAVNRVKVGL